MPLLSNKFSMPKIGLRKSGASRDENDDSQGDLSSKIPDEICFTPGDHTLVFEDGQWVLDSDGVAGTQRESSRLREKLHKLEQENNLLRIKLEIVTDILTETTAESHMQEKELQQLKSQLKSKKKK